MSTAEMLLQLAAAVDEPAAQQAGLTFRTLQHATTVFDSYGAHNVGQVSGLSGEGCGMGCSGCSVFRHESAWVMDVSCAPAGLLTFLSPIPPWIVTGGADSQLSAAGAV